MAAQLPLTAPLSPASLRTYLYKHGHDIPASPHKGSHKLTAMWPSSSASAAAPSSRDAVAVQSPAAQACTGQVGSPPRRAPPVPPTAVQEIYQRMLSLEYDGGSTSSSTSSASSAAASQVGTGSTNSQARAPRSSVDMDGTSAAHVQSILAALATSRDAEAVVTLQLRETTEDSGSDRGVGGSVNSSTLLEDMELSAYCQPRVSVSAYASSGNGDHDVTGGSSGAVSPIPIEPSPFQSRDPSQERLSVNSRARLLEILPHRSSPANSANAPPRSPSNTLHPPGSERRSAMFPFKPPSRRASHARKRSSWSSGDGVSMEFATAASATVGSGEFVLLTSPSSSAGRGNDQVDGQWIRESDIDLRMVESHDDSQVGTRAPANSIASSLSSPLRRSASLGDKTPVTPPTEGNTPDASKPAVPQRPQRSGSAAWKFWRKGSSSAASGVVSPSSPTTSWVQEDVYMQPISEAQPASATSTHVAVGAAGLVPGARGQTSAAAATISTQLPSQQQQMAALAPGIEQGQGSSRHPNASATSVGSAPPPPVVAMLHLATPQAPAPAQPSFAAALAPLVSSFSSSSSSSSFSAALKSPSTPKNKAPASSSSSTTEQGRSGGHKRQKSHRGDDVHSPRSATMMSEPGPTQSSSPPVSQPVLLHRTPKATWRSLASAGGQGTSRRGSIASVGDNATGIPGGAYLVPSSADDAPVDADSAPPSPRSDSPSPGAASNSYDDSVYELPSLLDLRSPRPPRIVAAAPSGPLSVQAVSSWTKTTFFPHLLPANPSKLRMASKPASSTASSASPPALTASTVASPPISSAPAHHPTLSSKAASLLGLAPPRVVTGGVSSSATTAANSGASSAASSPGPSSTTSSPKLRPLVAAAMPPPLPGQRSASMIVVGSNGTPLLSSSTGNPQLSPSPPAIAVSGPFSELRSIISGHGPGYLLFLRHLQREYAQESLLFWKAMENFLPLAARDVEREEAEAAAKAQAYEETESRAAETTVPLLVAATTTDLSRRSSSVCSEVPPPPAGPPPASPVLAPTAPAGPDRCGFSLLYLSIYNMYLRSGSKSEINISSALREKLKRVALQHELRLAVARGDRVPPPPPPPPVVAPEMKIPPRSPLRLNHIELPCATDEDGMDALPLVANPMLGSDTVASIMATCASPSAKRPADTRSKSLFVKTPAPGSRKDAASERSGPAPPSGGTFDLDSPPSTVQRRFSTEGFNAHRQNSHSVSELVLAEMRLEDSPVAAPLVPPPVARHTITSPILSPRHSQLQQRAAMSPPAVPKNEGGLAWQTYQHLFASQKEVENLLIQDCLPRFKHSPLWSKYIAATGAATQALLLAQQSAPASTMLSAYASPVGSNAASPIQSPRFTDFAPSSSPLPPFQLGVAASSVPSASSSFLLSKEAAASRVAASSAGAFQAHNAGGPSHTFSSATVHVRKVPAPFPVPPSSTTGAASTSSSVGGHVTVHVPSRHGTVGAEVFAATAAAANSRTRARTVHGGAANT